MVRGGQQAEPDRIAPPAYKVKINIKICSNLSKSIIGEG